MKIVTEGLRDTTLLNQKHPIIPDFHYLHFLCYLIP